MATVSVELYKHSSGDKVEFEWVAYPGFRPPVFVIWLPAIDGHGSIEIALSGDEIGRLRDALTRTPKEEVR